MIVDIIGWIGTFLVLSGYFLVSNEKIKPAGLPFNLINLFGALGIGINVFANQAWPSVALNLVWGTIAIFGLFKIWRLKSQNNQ